MVLGFAPLNPAGGSATYDADVLYTVHFDNNADNAADHSVHVRFGQNTAGEWGVQLEGLPGVTGAVSGPVETTLTAGTGQAWAGLADDPFFFDFQGFEDTLATGMISFDADRDSFEGTNVTALVVEMDLAEALDGETTLSMWATARRKN